MTFEEQILRAEERYKKSEVLAKATDWKVKETARRVLFRLKSLQLDDVIAEAMTSDSSGTPDILERIIKANELMKVSFLYKGASVAKTVGRVIVKESSTRTLGHGTGFMVSPRLLLTNNHVLESKLLAKNSLIEFNYRENFFGDITASIKFKLKPNEFFFTDSALDFSLVAVEKINNTGTQLSELGWNQLIRDSGKAVVGEHVNIIQHPSAEPKQVVVRQNTIKAINGSFIHYVTDTQRGSSGSPVYNDQWEIAALHHSGVPKRDADGNILLINGNIWNGLRSTMDNIAWVANEGVRVSEIIGHLDNQTMTLTEKNLYQEMFNATPNHLESDDNKNSIHQGPIEESDGSTSWYFRLNFGPAFNGAPNIGTATQKIIEEPEEPIGLPHEDDALAVFNAAVSEEEAYYKKEKDIENRDTYYSSIDFNLSPQDLYRTLSNHLRNTHNKQFSYKKARWQHLYPIVDRREAGNLRNIYSGSIIDPIEVIRREMVMIEEQEEMILQQLESQNFTTEIEREDAIDLLEAQLPFNCEHVVPQSWFNKKQPMRSDLHHLFACEPKCNSFRSNIPYYQFDPLEEVVQDECGQREQDKFEPEIGHGAVARATLYFLLRYPGLIGDETRELQKNRLSLLLEWHKRYPVDKYELHRNATIFTAQGNRNPLIDLPNCAEKIDFQQGFNV